MITDGGDSVGREVAHLNGGTHGGAQGHTGETSLLPVETAG